MLEKTWKSSHVVYHFKRNFILNNFYERTVGLISKQHMKWHNFSDQNEKEIKKKVCYFKQKFFSHLVSFFTTTFILTFIISLTLIFIAIIAWVLSTLVIPLLLAVDFLHNHKIFHIPFELYCTSKHFLLH